MSERRLSLRLCLLLLLVACGLLAAGSGHAALHDVGDEADCATCHFSSSSPPDLDFNDVPVREVSGRLASFIASAPESFARTSRSPRGPPAGA